MCFGRAVGRAKHLGAMGAVPGDSQRCRGALGGIGGHLGLDGVAVGIGGGGGGNGDVEDDTVGAAFLGGPAESVVCAIGWAEEGGGRCLRNRLSDGDMLCAHLGCSCRTEE